MLSLRISSPAHGHRVDRGRQNGTIPIPPASVSQSGEEDATCAARGPISIVSIVAPARRFGSGDPDPVLPIDGWNPSLPASPLRHAAGKVPNTQRIDNVAVCP